MCYEWMMHSTNISYILLIKSISLSSQKCQVGQMGGDLLDLEPESSSEDEEDIIEPVPKKT